MSDVQVAGVVLVCLIVALCAVSLARIAAQSDRRQRELFRDWQTDERRAFLQSLQAEPPVRPTALGETHGASHDHEAEAGASERQEIYCHACTSYVQFDIDLALNGNQVLHCPRCGHEHCRVGQNGRIKGRSMGYAERFHAPDSHDFGIHIGERSAA